MKKILILNTTMEVGGAARVAKDIFDEMSNKFEVYFAYGRGEKKEGKYYFKFGNKIEFFLHVFLVRVFGLEGFGSYYSTRKLIQFIKREKFELVHLHNLHGYYLNFFKLIRFLQKSKISVIWTLHDEWAITWLPAYTDAYENNFSLKNWINNTQIYPKNYFPVFKKFMLNKKHEVFTGDWNPLLICPSEWLKSKIENSYLKKYAIDVVYNGIDTDVFRPLNNKKELRAKFGLPVNSSIIFFAAANFNDKRKGIENVINAAKQLSKCNCFFVGVGAGNIEHLDNMKILGYIGEKERLAELYCLADIFCFTSSSETFLLTVAESLSCGTPVVGYKIPVVSEIFRGPVGLLVDLTNKNLLAQSMLSLLDDEQTRLEMGALGRRLVLENYSKDIFYKRYFDSYNKK